MKVEEFLQNLESFEFLDVLDRVGIPGFKERNVCAFHTEKSGSMFIRKHFYICFGCGAKGSVLNFIQNLKGLSFIEAVDLVSTSLGMEVQFGKYNKVKTYEDLFEKSLEFIEYSVDPKVKEQHERLPSAGFFDPDFDWGDQWALSGRVVLPIRTLSGKIVGFSGRAIDPSVQPKWLHSNNLPINYYITSNNLKKIILVEGPGDAEALKKTLGADSEWTPVATLGAHVSREHAMLLKGREAIIMFDGDTAGRNGAIQICRYDTPWRDIRIANLPDGEDPGTLDKEALEAAVKDSVQLLDYVVEHAERLMKTKDAVVFNRELVLTKFAEAQGGLSEAELKYKFPDDFNGGEGISLNQAIYDINTDSMKVSIASRDVAYPLRLVATALPKLSEQLTKVKIGEAEYPLYTDDNVQKIPPLLDQSPESAEKLLKAMYRDLYKDLV